MLRGFDGGHAHEGPRTGGKSGACVGRDSVPLSAPSQIKSTRRGATLSLLGQVRRHRLVQMLLDHHGVAVAPGHFFDAPAHFRLSLAGRAKALENGLWRISEALQTWKI